MRRVIIESPFAGTTQEEIVDNLEYAREALLDSINRGEVPMASHLLYTQVLDDTQPGERMLGITLGHEWMYVAHAAVVYTDRGYTSGMKAGVQRAEAFGLTVEYRSIR